jgi:hypothetical protein
VAAAYFNARKDRKRERDGKRMGLRIQCWVCGLQDAYLLLCAIIMKKKNP